MLRKLLLSILFVFFFSSGVFAQTGSITGTVINQDGEPVPTANVLLVEIGRGDATNLQGEYTIENVEAGTYTLRVTFVGYKEYRDQVTLEAGQTLTQDVVLQRGAIGLKKLIVTGFGKQSKVEFSGSAAQINMQQQVQNVPVVDVTSALQGAAAGVQISGNSGTPGAVNDINIRGVSSINAGGAPLYVVDGVPVLSGEFSAMSGSEMGLMATLNPADIASVTILKGPLATAQYGARGSNGVIVITTKSGTAGETQYAFSIQRGFVSRAVDGQESLTAAQAAMLYREAHKNIGDPVPKDLPFWNGPYDNIPGVVNSNWKSVVTNEDAITQSFNLSARGGTERATFYASLNFNKQESVIIGSQFNRIGGKVNFTYDFSEDVNISNHFTGSYTKLEGLDEGTESYVSPGGGFSNPMLATYFLPSMVPVYDKDGSINLYPAIPYNPLYVLKNSIRRTKTYRVLNSTQLNIDILDNLTFYSEVGLDFAVYEDKSYFDPIYGGAQNVNGSSEAGYTRIFSGTIQNGLDYTWVINENNALDISLVQSAQLYEFYRISAEASGFAALGLTNLASAATPRGAFSAARDAAILSFLAKIHYGYKDKIFFDATIRQEANSRFAEGQRWGTFYGLGATWLLTSEDFLNDEEWLDLLKIRASFGLSGNDAIGYNQYQSLLGFSSAYAATPGVVPVQLGNLSLSWEKARKINAGLTLGLFNRIDANITVFRSKSYNLLYEVPLSLTTGFNSQFRNVGGLVNRGIELALDVDVIRTDNFQLSVNSNFTFMRNEVTQLPVGPDGKPITLTNTLKHVAAVGLPVGSWYMKTYAGVNAQNGLPLWQLNRKPTQAEIKSGAVFKLDRFGDTWLTSDYSKAQKEYQGASGVPTKYGSISVYINYKGFFANASLYASFGNKVFDYWTDYMASDGGYPVTVFGQYATQLQRWQEPGDITYVPKRIPGGNNFSAAESSRFLYDGDYLRLSTVRVGYNVPATFLGNLNIGLSDASIYMSANNTWTYVFDDRLEFDPATGDYGLISYFAPVMQKITFGINLQF